MGQVGGWGSSEQHTVGTPRIVQRYECFGGPLDGQTRAAAGPPTGERLYIVRYEGDAPEAEPLECPIPPPQQAQFTVLGYYTLQRDGNRRRGTRTRLTWVSFAPWPVWVNADPWRPPPKDPPPPDFTQDPEG